MSDEIGTRLRAARERQGIDLTAVERETKIRERYLRALEEGRWDEMPGEAYARGFLATYGRYLGLDERALLADHSRLREPRSEPQPIPEEMLPRRGEARRRPGGPWLAIAAIGLVAGLAVVLALALGGGSADEPKRGGHGRGAATGSSSSTSSTTTEARPSSVALELRSTGTVWVCVVDEQGRPLVNGETLSDDQARGPFKGSSFRLTFGNGAVEMSVDGRPFPVPQLAEPQGYRVGIDGVTRLDPAQQPTCS